MGSFLIFVTQNVFYFLPEYPLIDSEKTELSFHYPKTSFLMSPAFLGYANKCSYGVKMPRLGTADGKKAVISIPPLNEQVRIVATIEQSFAQLNSIVTILS